MEEDADNLASNIVKDLRNEYGFYNIYDKNVVLDFNVVKDLLEQKYGMKYLGFDEDTELQIKYKKCSQKGCIFFVIKKC